MPVHPGAAPVEQDGSASAVADGPVEGAADGRREWDEHGLAAFAGDAQDAVAVFFAEVADVQPGGFEDPQSEEAQETDQREVAPVRGLAGCGEQGFELQMGQPEGG
jgi:hypothetical protein